MPPEPDAAHAAVLASAARHPPTDADALRLALCIARSESIAAAMLLSTMVDRLWAILRDASTWSERHDTGDEYVMGFEVPSGADIDLALPYVGTVAGIGTRGAGLLLFRLPVPAAAAVREELGDAIVEESPVVGGFVQLVARLADGDSFVMPLWTTELRIVVLSTGTAPQPVR